MPITNCTRCGALFRASEEEGNAPDRTCVACYRPPSIAALRQLAFRLLAECHAAEVSGILLEIIPHPEGGPRLLGICTRAPHEVLGTSFEFPCTVGEVARGMVRLCEEIRGALAPSV